MSKKVKIIIASAVLIVSAAGLATVFLVNNKSSNNNEQQTSQTSEAEPEDKGTVKPTNTEKTPEPQPKTAPPPPQLAIDNPASASVVVNKQRPISSSYSPSDLRKPNVALKSSGLALRAEAASALERMFTDASAQSANLMLGSAYRSYSSQSSIYNNYVRSYGQAEADRFSARPGTSEHQTGWAADLSQRYDQSCWLEICFGATAEGQWLKNNAHKYGFIIRYPNGKEGITGYQYEPWHVRYFGTDLANKIHSAGQTVEEYFNL